MDIKITKAPTGGTVAAIPSKSAAHRILIAAALTGLDIGPYCDGLSQDISATKACLQALIAHPKAGPSTQHAPLPPQESRAVKPETKDTGKADATEEGKAGAAVAQLPCGESGSTLRFLIPVAAVLGVDADLHCEGRLPDRPMQPFLEVLASHGCQVTERNPKKLRGRLAGGDFTLPGNISSQYVTGLLMALPLAEEDSRIIVEGTLQSRPYIDLTLEVLRQAGIVVHEGEDTVFHIPGRQQYRLPEEALQHIEGDWSNAAFWLVMDAMSQGRIDCTGLDAGSSQGDKAITQIIRQIESAGNDPVDIDVSNVPDLVPITAAFACSRPLGAVTNIVNAGRLRMKESDRLQSVTAVLQTLGADITELPEGLTIRGTEGLQGGEISAWGDHRIAMMAAAAACIASGDIIIHGAEAVNKSYPAFFDDFRALGGRAEVIGGQQ